MSSRIIEEFERKGYVSGKFSSYLSSDKEILKLIPSEEKASRATIAKLYYLFKNDFLRKALEKERG
ncbi:MAG: hypothetical protein ACUVUG_01720 [Candidatus Aminicenantia bacterium]